MPNDPGRADIQLLDFAPYPLLNDIAEHARENIYPTVTSVEGWARGIAAERREYDIEVDKGSHALETLLENHIDRSFDKFTAYALRNAFNVPDGVELVLVSRVKCLAGLETSPDRSRIKLLS